MESFNCGSSKFVLLYWEQRGEPHLVTECYVRRCAPSWTMNFSWEKWRFGTGRQFITVTLVSQKAQTQNEKYWRIYGLSECLETLY